jgi:hypothetical protein
MKCRPKARRFLRHGSQCSAILVHLKAGRVLTTAQAVDKFDCYRLSQRIIELKNRGHVIHSTMVRLPSKKRVAVYAMDL